MKVAIVGSGIVGLTCAEVLLRAGCAVRLLTASQGVDESLCSWWAGGMLAPFCEMETAEPLVGQLAPIAMAYWQSFCQRNDGCHYVNNGTLVLSPNRDNNMLVHFAQKTQQWQRLNQQALCKLEPSVDAHNQALFYPLEAHIEPRKVLAALWRSVCEAAEKVETKTHLSDSDIKDLQTEANWVLDCRGYGARASLPELRGVRGEMLHLYCPEVKLSRPLRLLHPRIPIYLVPRANGQLMLGATMIENSARERASVRSVMDLLSAAYAVNPAISQAEIVEMGVDVRPAFTDNLPKVVRHQRVLSVNGMYRHGYLLAPAIAEIVRDYLVEQKPNPLIDDA